MKIRRTVAALISTAAAIVVVGSVAAPATAATTVGYNAAENRYCELAAEGPLIGATLLPGVGNCDQLLAISYKLLEGRQDDVPETILRSWLMTQMGMTDQQATWEESVSHALIPGNILAPAETQDDDTLAA